MTELIADEIQVISTALNWRLYLVDNAQATKLSDENRQLLRMLLFEFTDQKQACLFESIEYVDINLQADNYRCETGEMQVPLDYTRLLCESLEMFLDRDLNSQTEIEVATGLPMAANEAVLKKLQTATAQVIPSVNEPAKSSDLSFLVGQPCWGIVAGPGAGSMITLMVGQKIPRETLFPNDKLSREVRENDAEFSICLFYCSWRLRSADEIICSAMWSSNEADGPMLEGLSRIQDQRIASIDVTPDTCDMKIRFDNGLTLDVFNDHPDESSSCASFWIDTPDAHYTVSHFKFEREDHEES